MLVFLKLDVKTYLSTTEWDQDSEHLPIGGWLVTSQVLSWLVTNKSMSFIFFVFATKSLGYTWNRHSLGSTGIIHSVKLEIRLRVSFQNVWRFWHFQMQWSKVPFSILHLKQISGMLGFEWFSLAGVMWILKSHLYCNNLPLVLILWVWTKRRAFSHSSVDISSCRSFL